MNVNQSGLCCESTPGILNICSEFPETGKYENLEALCSAHTELLKNINQSVFGLSRN